MARSAVKWEISVIVPQRNVVRPIMYESADVSWMWDWNSMVWGRGNLLVNSFLFSPLSTTKAVKHLVLLVWSLVFKWKHYHWYAPIIVVTLYSCFWMVIMILISTLLDQDIPNIYLDVEGSVYIPPGSDPSFYGLTLILSGDLILDHGASILLNGGSSLVIGGTHAILLRFLLST